MGKESNVSCIVPIGHAAANRHAHVANASAPDSSSRPPNQTNNSNQTPSEHKTICQKTWEKVKPVLEPICILLGFKSVHVLHDDKLVLHLFHALNSLKFLTKIISIRNTIIGSIVRIRLMMWSLLLLLIARTVPTLKHIMFLRLPLWRWALLFFSLCLGKIMLKWTAFFVFKAIDVLYSKNPTLGYWAKGLRRKVAHVVFFIILLVIWIRLFHWRPDLHDRVSMFMFKHVTWALGSLVLGALLWLVKSILLLFWEAHTIYHHFKGRIIKVGRQLYIMILICKPWLDIANNTEENEWRENTIMLLRLMMDARNILISNSKDTSLLDVKVMAKYFMFLSKVSPREDDHVLDEWVKEMYIYLIRDNKYINQEELKDKLKTKYKEKDEKASNKWIQKILSKVKEKTPFLKEQKIEEIIDSGLKCLWKDLKKNKDGEVDAETFKKYMNNAYKNSLALGRTLSNADEVQKHLDTIIRVFLVALVILFWLILSDLASTRVLVAFGSLFVTAIFIFGDTCKRMFEGIIFSFVTHPFDVGDLCVIDDTQLEVKRIGVLKTTFLKIGGKEEMLYPTSVLATKSIVNFKGDPDVNDKVELCLDIHEANSDLIDSFKTKIKNFLKEDEKYEEYHEVVIKEVGSDIKLAIHFKHRLGSGDVFHAQCVQKKNKQRSEFFLKVKELLANKSNILKRSASSPA